MSTDTAIRDALNEAAAAAGLRLDPTVGEDDLTAVEGPFITMEVAAAGGDGPAIVVGLRDGPESDAELLETLAVAAAGTGGPAPTEGQPVLTGAELAARFDTPVSVTALTDGTAVQALVINRSDRRTQPEEDAVAQADDSGGVDTASAEDAGPAVTPAPSPPPASSPAPAPGSVPAALSASLDKLVNVELGVSVELGRAHVTLAEVLDYDVGSIIELDRAAGAPVDVRVNGMLLAQGEVVLIDDEYAVRVTAIVDAQADR